MRNRILKECIIVFSITLLFLLLVSFLFIYLNFSSYYGDNNITYNIIYQYQDKSSEPLVLKESITQLFVNRYYDVPLEYNIQDYIYDTCKKYNNVVPVELVICLIEHESSFRSDIISNTGDYGYCQINSCNFNFLNKSLGVTDLLDPYQNIESCIFILSEHIIRCNGDLNKALMCYNMGYNGAKRHWNKGEYSSSYSKAILINYECMLNDQVIN